MAITQYSLEEYYDGSTVFVCFSKVENLPPCLFFILSIIFFFLIPLAILIFLYTLIAKTLIDHPNIMAPKSSSMPSQSVIKYRKQVVLMLGTVVVAFFICLLPFRALTLWIIVVPAESIMNIGLHNYYNLLYFSRIMFHINSAINPILYNVMSSKFRGGFLKLCGVRVFRKGLRKLETSRKSTHSSSTHTSSQHTSESLVNRYSSNRSNARAAQREERAHVKETYVRIPLRIVGGISGEQIPNDEIYV